MALRIFPIESLSCGPTAVCAVTGKDSKTVLDAMRQAANEDGRPDHHWKDSAFRDQARAVEILGFELFDESGSKIDAKSLSMNPFFQRGSKITEFVRQNRSPDVVIATAWKAGTITSHTFVVDGQSYFDSCTGGRIVSANEIPANVGDFEVTGAWIVRKAASGALTAHEAPVTSKSPTTFGSKAVVKCLICSLRATANLLKSLRRKGGRVV